MAKYVVLPQAKKKAKTQTFGCSPGHDHGPFLGPSCFEYSFPLDVCVRLCLVRRLVFDAAVGLEGAGVRLLFVCCRKLKLWKLLKR
jgi:hypothetical protein